MNDNTLEPEMTVERQCPLCGKITAIEVNFEEFAAWKGGALIQDAMPHMSVDDREILMTGICPQCWDSQFGDEDDEE